MRIDFACNDERGMFMGKAKCVTFGELNLECLLIGGGVQMKLYKYELNLLKVGRIVMRFKYHTYGLGNLCWDGYGGINNRDAVRLINYLMRRKYWDCCDESPTELYDKFKAKQPFTIEDLKLY